MNPKERFLTAMRGGIADRVPVSPDFSNYIPARRTGLPFWDIYLFGQTPLWKNYLDTADYFGIDAWMASCCGAALIDGKSDVEHECKDHFDEINDGYVRDITIKTPAGELTQKIMCLRNDPPSQLERLIKNIEEDFPKFKHLKSIPKAINREIMDEMRGECEKREYAFGVSVGYPGFHAWSNNIENGLMLLSCQEMDNPKILEEWYELDLEIGTKTIELLIDYKPDYICFGGSGTITLASPDLAMKYAIPPLKKWSEMAKEAGIPTILHSCGKSRELVDMLCDHTDVNCVNPLEIAPMGDVDLKELKKKRGDQIALMGNLHTTNVMLNGTPELVKEKSRQAIRDAGENGGFILSTGDQCGYHTPDENIFTMVEAAKEFGRY